MPTPLFLTHYHPAVGIFLPAVGAGMKKAGAAGRHRLESLSGLGCPD
ncbi:hypothetical protein D8I24_4785 [Cupriavidus necator H850]|nr:hypothetical protein D8I24_4785 [Cupriavidus necator H850]